MSENEISERIMEIIETETGGFSKEMNLLPTEKTDRSRSPKVQGEPRVT